MEKQHLTRRGLIESSSKTLTRRDFLKLAGVTAGATVMAVGAPEVAMASPSQVVNVSAFPASKPGPVTMDVWWISTIEDLYSSWSGPDGPEWYFGGLARAAFLPWLARHPGVTLKITNHDWDGGLYFNQIQAMASDTMGDTSYGEAYVPEFVRMGAFRPISPATAALFPAGTIGNAVVDGICYGIPQSTGTNVLMINLEVLQKAGLSTTHFPKNWDQLLSNAQTVSQVNYSEEWGHNAYFCYGPGYGTYGVAMRVLPWFNQNGAPLADDSGYPSANTQKAVDTWAFHNALMATTNPNLILNGDPTQLLNAGVLSYRIGWSGDMADAGDNITAVPLPQPLGGGPGNIIVGNQINSACKRGKNPDLGSDLVENVWTQEAAQAWLPQNAGIWIPALKSMLAQWKTYDQLDAYHTDSAKAMVRLTMHEVLYGNAGPVTKWPRNGFQCWWDWTTAYSNIWSNNLQPDAIKAELDNLQSTLPYDIYYRQIG